MSWDAQEKLDGVAGDRDGVVSLLDLLFCNLTWMNGFWIYLVLFSWFSHLIVLIVSRHFVCAKGPKHFCLSVCLCCLQSLLIKLIVVFGNPFWLIVWNDFAVLLLLLLLFNLLLLVFAVVFSTNHSALTVPYKMPVWHRKSLQVNSKLLHLVRCASKVMGGLHIPPSRTFMYSLYSDRHRMFCWTLSLLLFWSRSHYLLAENTSGVSKSFKNFICFQFSKSFLTLSFKVWMHCLWVLQRESYKSVFLHLYT